jgi:hypothetical protein
MRAMEPEKAKWKDKDETRASRSFWVNALKENAPHHYDAVLLSTLTILEFQLDPNAGKMPSIHGVEYVAFDDVVADDMARWCKPSVIDFVCKETGFYRSVVKYDAMIVACARAHNASLIVTLDSGVLLLAKTAGIKAAGPGEFRPVQGSLF